MQPSGCVSKHDRFFKDFIIYKLVLQPENKEIKITATTKNKANWRNQQN